MTEEREIYTALAEATARGKSVVLATIVRAKGSTPRDVGSKMLIDLLDGPTGTVGGGCGEAEVIETAARVAANGQAKVISVDLTEDALSWSPAICGGVFDVLLEPWSAADE